MNNQEESFNITQAGQKSDDTDIFILLYFSRRGEIYETAFLKIYMYHSFSPKAANQRLHGMVTLYNLFIWVVQSSGFYRSLLTMQLA